MTPIFLVKVYYPFYNVEQFCIRTDTLFYYPSFKYD